MTSTLCIPVRQIVKMLVDGHYEQIARITHSKRLDTTTIEGAILGYGMTLVMPPDVAFEQLDVVKIKNAALPCWSVRMNLWTAEEGQSDLSIELTLTKVESDYVIELDDIHVL